MFCPYCGEEKDAEVFTEEHVIPRSLGGALEPTNPFKLPVCTRCNNVAGRFIEAPAVRSWLLRLRRAPVRSDPFAPNAPPILLQFMGTLDGWNDTESVCDFWLGPTGDHVFHFHRPYPGATTMVGGDPGPRDDLDPGVVLVGVVATNPAWHPVIRGSVTAEFADSPIYYLHETAPPALERHRVWIESLGLTRKTSVSMEVGSGQRLSAKLALGIASIALGEAYQRSPDAAVLRQFMRSRDSEARASLGLRGHALLNLTGGDEALVRMFGWRDCHTIALVPKANELACVVVLYGAHGMVLPITSDPQLWQPHLTDWGRAWVIAPGLRRFAGPSSVPAMLIDAAEETPNGPLAGLAARMAAIPELPPVHLGSNPASEGS